MAESDKVVRKIRAATRKQFNASMPSTEKSSAKAPVHHGNCAKLGCTSIFSLKIYRLKDIIKSHEKSFFRKEMLLVPFSRILLTYAVSVPVFFVIDMIWLGVIARGFYRKALEPLLTPNINWTAALIFYFLFLAGVLIFALLPGMEKRSLGYTISMAALFGFIAYATYDLTNLATLRDWPLMLSIVDMAWGTFLSASTAAITYLIMSRIPSA